MLKPIKWSSFADNDFAIILEYLHNKWDTTVVSNFITEVDYCIMLIQKNPKQFPIFNKDLRIRKCVITKHNTLFFRETSTLIEILRLYDTRQNPLTLRF